MTTSTPGSSVDPSAVKIALQKAFPSADVTPEIVASVMQAIQSGASAWPSAGADSYRYYIAAAAHRRNVGTTSAFVGELPLVRVPLPDEGDFHSNVVPTIQTAIGYL